MSSKPNKPRGWSAPLWAELLFAALGAVFVLALFAAYIVLLTIINNS